jgi:hypothetical protein
MEALMVLTKEAEPPSVPVRPTACKATFLVGDASGSGFGTSTWVQDDDKITAQYGAWDDNVCNQSSNFWEAYNLVLRVEQMVARGELERGSEVFVFTDNFVSERAFYNGSSKSKWLHGLVMRLRKLEMDGQIFIRVIWFAGTRMINQGTDGLSCGDFTGGVMAGHRFLRFLPLNRNVLERQKDFSRNFGRGLPGKNWKWLDETGWFEEAYLNDQGCYVWCPSPALADVALEQMCEIKHIHPGTSHCFLCPNLMTSHWRKQLLKASDVCVSLVQGSAFWPASQHEPLVCALTRPILASSP